MKIIVPKEIAIKIFEAVKKEGLCEIKGSLYAQFISENQYKIEDVFISKNKGTHFFSNLIINHAYHKFEKQYFKKHNYDYVNHNYIGDWHSHPSFECKPSSYDEKEIKTELLSSNAHFLIQLIVKVIDDELCGNCFCCNRDMVLRKCDLIIEK